MRHNFPEPYFSPNAKPSASEQRNIDTIYRVMQEFWFLASRTAAHEVFDKDAMRHDPLVPNIIGPDDYTDMVEEYHESWKFKSFHLHIALAERDWVAWRVMTRAKHIGDFYGVPATGADLEVITQTFVILNKDHQPREAFIVTDYMTVVKTMLSALPLWKLLVYAPRMYREMKKQWTLMNESGHRPAARPEHAPISSSDDGFIHGNFPRPYLEAEKPTPEETRHIAVILRVNQEYWFQGRTEIGHELFAPNHLRHDPMIPDTGLEGYSALIKYFHQAFEFKIMDTQIVLAEGDFVAFRTVTKAVHKGEFYGIPATGAEVSVVTHVFVKFNEDDLIVEAWGVTDYLSLFMDLLFAMSSWQRITSLPAIYKRVREHLDVLHSPENRSISPALPELKKETT